MMFYKPDYCNNCGEKIETAERRFWEHSRFCENCKEDFKIEEWMPTVLGCICVLVGLFGVGNFLQKNEKPLPLATRQIADASAESQKKSRGKDESAPAAGNTNSQVLPVTKQLPENADQSLRANGVQANQPKELKSVQTVSDAEPVYFCGAATKKGTPCSRRVKSGGRCWQHPGQAAILPPDKLLVRK